MRGTFDLDPAACQCGPATAAVRQILTEWAAIDWFVPPRDPNAEVWAAQLLRQHNARARAHLPEVFPAQVETRVVEGGWREFKALCDRVRTQRWDWKFAGLKKLSAAHSQARGWKLDDQVPREASLHDGKRPGPGDLFFRIGDLAVWNALYLKLDLEAFLPAEAVDPVAFYFGHAQMDITECLAWQLAERSSDMEGNPFLPLLRCYAAGLYPFGVDPSTFLMFALRR